MSSGAISPHPWEGCVLFIVRVVGPTYELIVNSNHYKWERFNRCQRLFTIINKTRITMDAPRFRF